MEEKIVPLDESDLDGVAGGAFNQKTVDRLGLDVKTHSTGTQLLKRVDMRYSERRGSAIYWDQSTGIISEGELRSSVNRYDNLSVSARTTSGEMIQLSKEDITELLS